MSTQTLAHDYIPREPFKPFHARTQRFAVIVAHRRAGKTVAVVNDMVVRAMRTKKERWFGAYIAPYMNQARQISFGYLKHAVRKLPGIKIHESESAITFPNGSKIRVFGADNADALRGLYFDHVVLDEVGDIPRRVWAEVIRPALADRQGSAVFMGTPKGRNFFYDLKEKAKASNGKWFFTLITADTSGIIPDRELQEIKQDTDPDEYAQEFLCDFDASSAKGSYYGKLMSMIEDQGKIKSLAIDYDEPVSCSLDIGHRDATAIWFWQIINGEVRFIDYWEAQSYDAAEVVDLLQFKPYKYETIWLPHDAKNHTFATKKTVLDTFIEADAPARIVKRIEIKDGIDAVRRTLRTYPLAFDGERCKRGLDALKNYSRKWDNDKKVFSNTANHDEWSHGADSFRYACTVINQESIQLSIERARQKRQVLERAKQTNQVISANQFQSTYTFAQALADHDRKIRLQKGSGRSRI